MSLGSNEELLVLKTGSVVTSFDLGENYSTLCKDSLVLGSVCLTTGHKVAGSIPGTGIGVHSAS